MSLKVFKYNSDNNPNSPNGFGTTDNIRFTIPQSLGKVDLSKSYINLNVELDTVQNANISGAGLTAVYNDTMVYGNPNQNLPARNNCVIRNVSLKSQKGGMIESIREISTLNQIVDARTRSLNEVRAENYYSGFSGADNIFERDTFGSVYRHLNRVGSEVSRNLKPSLPIPLKQLLGSCVIQEFPVYASGDIQVEVELDLTNVSPFEPLTYIAGSELDCNNVDNNSGGDLNLGTDLPLTSTSTDFHSDEDIRLWVGCAVRIAFKNDGTDTHSYSVIQTITRNDNGSITFTTETSLGLIANTKSATDIGVRQITGGNSTFKVDSAEIVLFQSQDTSSKDTSFEFTTWGLEMINSPQNSTRFYQFYDINPNVANLMLLSPNNNDSGRLSNANNITHWRWRINDKEVFNQDIVIGTPLYLDNHVRTYQNMNKPLKNLRAVYGTNVNLFDSLLPMPLDGKSHQVQISLEASGVMNARIFYLYKQTIKNMTVRKGTVQIN